MLCMQEILERERAIERDREFLREARRERYRRLHPPPAPPIAPPPGRAVVPLGSTAGQSGAVADSVQGRDQRRPSGSAARVTNEIYMLFQALRDMLFQALRDRFSEVWDTCYLTPLGGCCQKEAACWRGGACCPNLIDS